LERVLLSPYEARILLELLFLNASKTLSFDKKILLLLIGELIIISFADIGDD